MVDFPGSTLVSSLDAVPTREAWEYAEGKIHLTPVCIEEQRSLIPHQPTAEEALGGAPFASFPPSPPDLLITTSLAIPPSTGSCTKQPEDRSLHYRNLTEADFQTDAAGNSLLDGLWDILQKGDPVRDNSFQGRPLGLMRKGASVFMVLDGVGDNSSDASLLDQERPISYYFGKGDEAKPFTLAAWAGTEITANNTRVLAGQLQLGGKIRREAYLDWYETLVGEGPLLADGSGRCGVNLKQLATLKKAGDAGDNKEFETAVAKLPPNYRTRPIPDDPERVEPFAKAMLASAPESPGTEWPMIGAIGTVMLAAGIVAYEWARWRESRKKERKRDFCIVKAWVDGFSASRNGTLDPDFMLQAGMESLLRCMGERRVTKELPASADARETPALSDEKRNGSARTLLEEPWHAPIGDRLMEAYQATADVVAGAWEVVKGTAAEVPHTALAEAAFVLAATATAFKFVGNRVGGFLILPESVFDRRA